MSEQRRELRLGNLLRDIWRRKLLFLGVFLAVFGLSVGWVLTIKPTYTSTQVVVLVPPAAETGAEATQQSAVLVGSLGTFNRLVTHPLVIGPLVGNHEEFPTTAALESAIKVELTSALMLELNVTASTPEAAEALVQDLAASFVANAPKALAAWPDAIRIGLDAVPEVTTQQDSSGKLTRLFAGFVGALVVAVVAALAIPRRK